MVGEEDFPRYSMYARGLKSTSPLALFAQRS